MSEKMSEAWFCLDVGDDPDMGLMIDWPTLCNNAIQCARATVENREAVLVAAVAMGGSIGQIAVLTMQGATLLDERITEQTPFSAILPRLQNALFHKQVWAYGVDELRELLGNEYTRSGRIRGVGLDAWLCVQEWCCASVLYSVYMGSQQPDGSFGHQPLTVDDPSAREICHLALEFLHEIADSALLREE
jgi:hypothetical protein